MAINICMNKVLIMGDSWGIGEFKYSPCKTTIESVSNTGLNYFLEKLGYRVDNISVAGGSNIEQFDLLTPGYDLIIWFHTEINRDLLKNSSTNYSNTLSYIESYNLAAEHNYKIAQEFYNNYKIPFIVIGCLSPLHESIEKYNFYIHIEKNWITNETGIITALNMHSDYMLKVLEKYNFKDCASITKEIDNMLYVESILEKHPSFSDGIHPTAKMYKDLATKLHLKITSSN